MRLLYSLIILIGLTAAARADVSVVVDRATQRVTATINGTVHVWPTSTGLKAGWTRPGIYGVQGMDENHRSSIYNNAPMPHSVFFNGDVAFHGTTETGMLGQPASHGCVRLHPAHAKILFDAIRRNGSKAHIQVL